MFCDTEQQRFGRMRVEKEKENPVAGWIADHLFSFKNIQIPGHNIRPTDPISLKEGLRILIFKVDQGILMFS